MRSLQRLVAVQQKNPVESAVPTQMTPMTYMSIDMDIVAVCCKATKLLLSAIYCSS